MTRTGTLTMALLLAAAVVAAWADPPPEDVRFGGGSYDGWDRDTMASSALLGGADVSFSSAPGQTFDFTAAYGDLATAMITATDPGTAITNGGTMRVTVPPAWGCRFDTGVSVTYGGNASGKVGAASYTDGGRVLSIPVTQNFTSGDTLTITGLRLVDLRLVSPGVANLELDFDGDGARDVYDAYSLTVRALWPGGSYDGWDRYEMAESGSLEPIRRGTVILIR